MLVFMISEISSFLHSTLQACSKFIAIFRAVCIWSPRSLRICGKLLVSLIF